MAQSYTYAYALYVDAYVAHLTPASSENQALRIESSAVINFRGASTKLKSIKQNLYFHARNLIKPTVHQRLFIVL